MRVAQPEAWSQRRWVWLAPHVALVVTWVLVVWVFLPVSEFEWLLFYRITFVFFTDLEGGGAAVSAVLDSAGGDWP